ncbi:archaeal proteasome endopeptidase complex subunit alpha [Candidatus Woesearchaeota archaeon]|nr:archaeal proteasome endopeptidase complex subunit alpha [Candidatus Woesearchaeota archaeon]
MQQPVQHQMMGYDRTSTMFSPDGRLLQVEYAKKAVKQGTAAIGMVCKDGVILVADRRLIDKNIVPESVEKIYQVDDHIGATATGYLMDGRILIEKAQLLSQQHRVTYDNVMDTKSLVKEICNVKQAFTQYGGARPFGISILFAGVDDGEPVLFETEPTGMFFQYKATAIGEGDTEIKKIFEKEYHEKIDIEEGFRLAVKALKKILEKDFDLKRMDGAYIKSSDGKFTRIDSNFLKKVIK